MISTSENTSAGNKQLQTVRQVC